MSQNVYKREEDMEINYLSNYAVRISLGVPRSCTFCNEVFDLCAWSSTEAGITCGYSALKCN